MNEQARVWSLQDAKAKFSEVVRRARSEGPQTVTVHGRAAVVITNAESEANAAGQGRTGVGLVKAMQLCPYPDFDIPELDEPALLRDAKS
jgi:prevent-host-death family protein